MTPRHAVRLLALCGAASLGCSDAPAPDVYVPRRAGTLTFSADIAPIVFENCAECHRPGESAPFSLLTYDDVRKRAGQIAAVTGSGFMPPWLPEAGHVQLADERRLSVHEIGAIAQWAQEGAAAGEAARMPAAPEWTAGWQLGEPDLVLHMPEPYTLAAEGTDVFRNFVVPTAEPTERYVRAVELRPGNPRIVHHAEILVDTTGASRRLEQRDSEPGFDSMDFGQAVKPDGHFLGWTPGKVPFDGGGSMAWTLERGADLVLQLHLLPSGKPETIRSSIGLFFSDEPPTIFPCLLRLGSMTIDIPAGKSDYTIRDSYVLPVDVEALSVYPHAHYLGKLMECTATLPDGERKTLLRIADWDFNWQDEYRFARPVALPAGTTLEMRYVYDNSTSNVRNPNQPPRRVVYGPQSSDEMGDLWLQVLPRDAADLATLERSFGRKDVQARSAGYEQAIRLDPGDAEALFNLGVSRLTQGRRAEALTLFRNALSYEPDHLGALNNVAFIHSLRDELPEARVLYERVIALRPDDPNARAKLGSILERQGDPDGAAQQYESAIALDAEHRRALLSLGVLLAKRGDLDPARMRLEALLAVDPDNAAACSSLGNVLFSQNELDRAATYYERALALQPDHPGVHFSLGALYSQQADLDQAAVHLERAVVLQPDRAAAHYNLGNVLAKQGKLQRAASHYERALEIDPASTAARNNLKRVRALIRRE